MPQYLRFERFWDECWLLFIDTSLNRGHAHKVPKIIQLRNVPDALHRTLKARAKSAGMSLSEYLLSEIKELATRPTLAEFRERLRKRKPVSVELDPTYIAREHRDAR